jgi:hypothetical protein
MKKYCKAYHLRDLRQFPEWREADTDAGTPLSDESIVYLWDDLTVVKSPIYPDKDVLWNAVTEDWQRFCRDTLHFEIPQDLRYAYAQSPDEQSAG